MHYYLCKMNIIFNLTNLLFILFYFKTYKPKNCKFKRHLRGIVPFKCTIQF